MSSRSTATSWPLPASDWQQALEAVPSALRHVSKPGAVYLNLFLESSRYALYTFRQRSVAGRVDSPQVEKATRYVEGASAASYGRNSLNLAVADGVSEQAILAAVVEAARSSAATDAGVARPLSPHTLDLSSAAAVAEDWPDMISQAWVAEAARGLAESCLDLPDVSAVLSVREATRRLSLFDTQGSAVCRREGAVTTTVRCQLSDGREIRAASGGSSLASTGSLFDQDALLISLRDQAMAVQAGRSWDSVSVPMVLAAGWCAGTWLHEAIGHLFEADNETPAGNAAFDVGARVAQHPIIMADDPVIPTARGSLTVDDEAVESRRKVLIANGVVQGRLHSRATAASAGVAPTGNGRRQDFRHAPLPRMTNLIIENGSSSRDDLLQAIPRGLLIREVGSASLDLDTGRFTLGVLLAEEVHSGRQGPPIAGFSVSGDALLALSGIRAVADDFAMDPARGSCLKRGQLVSVGLGSPSLLMDGLTVHLDR